MCLVPTGAREDVRPRSLAAAVGDDPRPAAGSVAMRHALIGRVKGSVHAAPIPNRKEVRRSTLPHLPSRPFDAVVLEWRTWGPHEVLGSVLDGLGPGAQLELRHRALFRVPVALVIVGQGLLLPAVGALPQADGERETERQLLCESHGTAKNLRAGVTQSNHETDCVFLSLRRCARKTSLHLPLYATRCRNQLPSAEGCCMLQARKAQKSPGLAAAQLRLRRAHRSRMPLTSEAADICIRN